MTVTDRLPSRVKALALLSLIVVQMGCLAFFLWDAFQDFKELPLGEWLSVHLTLELLANMTLLAAILVEAHFLRRMLQRQIHSDRALSVASGALYDVMMRHFDDWGLTPSETDVATFTIKGFSIAEVASMRGSAEGTVKTQLNAIYRKSGLSGRSQLVSLLIEDLLQGPVAPGRPPGSGMSADDETFARA
jgi:DNA-binding CsgD family transcriptional regulator